VKFLRSLYTEYLLVVLILAAGIAASLEMAWSYQAAWERQNAGRFEEVARDRLELIRNAIDNNNIVLRSITAFFRASDDVTAEEFQIFTSQLLEDNHYIHAIQWMPQVMAGETGAYDQICSPGYTLKEYNNGSGFTPVQAREKYFPICYVEPLQPNSEVLGFDYASHHERSNAIHDALKRRDISVTPRLELLQKMDKEKERIGVAFLSPVFQDSKIIDAATQKEIAYEKLTGFLATVVPLSHLIEFAIEPLNHAGVNILIHDLSQEQGNGQLLYVRSTRLKDIPDEEIIADYEANAGLAMREVMDAGGRKWQVSVISTRGYFEQAFQKESWLILIGGFGFTTLLGFYMVTRIRESAKIAREVEERTAELAAAKKETEMILLSTKEGIIGLDDEGKIKFCNPMTANLLGYTRKELIGKERHALLHAQQPDGTAYEIKDCPIHKTLHDGMPCTVSDEVFWTKDGAALEVEYTGSPIIDGGEIVGGVVVFRDISERKAMARKLEQMARFDQLTGLPNRAHFMESLKGALARSSRSGRKVGVIYMDLNGFKPVNDTLGHAAGDLLLKNFAGRLRQVVRDSDTPARLGGDEFTVIADNLASPEECIALVERIRNFFKEPFEIEGKNFSISASIGIAFSPDHAESLDELVSCADGAMYAAKKDKKRDYVIYSGNL